MWMVMPAVAVPVGVLSVANLALALAMVRRLREHGQNLRSLNEMLAPPESGLPPGTAVPALTATAESGAEVSTASFATGERFLAFVDTHCAACRTHLPQFVEAARGDVVVVVG